MIAGDPCDERERVPATARRYVAVVETDAEPLVLDERTRNAADAALQRHARRGDGVDGRVRSGMDVRDSATEDLEAVASAVDHSADTNACSEVAQQASGEDDNSRATMRGERPEDPAGRGREPGRARGRGDRREGAVEVKDRHDAGAAREFARKPRDEADRQAQGALTPAVSVGIRVSSFSSEPAQR